MAKGHGQNRSKKKQKRSAPQSGIQALIQQQSAAAPLQSGLEAIRGAVSGAYRSWMSDYVRRQTEAVAAQFDQASGQPIPQDLFLLVPLTTRTVSTPREETVMLQMGVPLVATRAGRIAPPPDRLAVAALRLPEGDSASAMAALGLGQAPDLPQPQLVFAAQLPAEGLRFLRGADAIAWYLAAAVEAGDVALDPQALAQAAGEALALLRPGLSARGEVRRLDPALLSSYSGYGSDTDEPVVPLDITSAPARGGLSGLPTGAFLQDNGASLRPLLDDLRDYVIGLWPYEYFALESLSAGGDDRKATLSALSNLVRRLDALLAESAESDEAALAAEGQPPAWIAQETAHYREARETLRASRVAQELLPQLGPILFDLELLPDDYQPSDGNDTDDEEME